MITARRRVCLTFRGSFGCTPPRGDRHTTLGALAFIKTGVQRGRRLTQRVRRWYSTVRKNLDQQIQVKVQKHQHRSAVLLYDPLSLLRLHVATCSVIKVRQICRAGLQLTNVFQRKLQIQDRNAKYKSVPRASWIHHPQHSVDEESFIGLGNSFNVTQPQNTDTCDSYLHSCL